MLKLDINLLYTVVNVLIMYALLRKFLFKPVQDVLDKRQKMVDDELANAQDAKTKAEADDKERDGAGGANGCKRPRAKHAPDDHGIDHGIELLEQIAEKQRDGEPEDKLHGRTARHFFCHTENFTPLREK